MYMAACLYACAHTRKTCQVLDVRDVSACLQDLGLRSCRLREALNVASLVAVHYGLWLLVYCLGQRLLCDSVFLQVNVSLGTSCHAAVGKLVEASQHSTLPHP